MCVGGGGGGGGGGGVCGGGGSKSAFWFVYLDAIALTLTVLENGT